MSDTLTCTIVFNDKEDNAKIILGGNPKNPTWEEYLKDYKEEYHPHFKLVREELEKQNLVGITGEQHQNKGISFKFSDGLHLAFTWRAWGDLMQAIVGKQEGYMKYYM